MSTSSRICGLTVLPCFLVNQSRHFVISLRNGFRRHTNRERTVRIWEYTGSFLEELVRRHFVYWMYELSKYTDHIAVKFSAIVISLKYNLTNEG